jgi:phage/plasmid-like protein (TIGR03299 family)
VYHTGGYLGDGEKIWLLAKIDKTIKIGTDDIVQPYALMANSHDGSLAFYIRLTTIRVVCQNTLGMAMREQLGQQFRRAHQGSFTQHARAAQEFFAATMRELDFVAQSFTELFRRSCSDEQAKQILAALLPDPKRPRNSEHNPRSLKAWEKKTAEIRRAKDMISKLRESGKGMGMEGSRGTFWGLLNAVLEYVDHYHKVEDSDSRVSYSLLGGGMDLKMQAFKLIQEKAA